MDKPYDIYDYEVLDRNGSRLGPVTGFWVDETTGEPEFASVKTGWLAGKQHVIPIRDAAFDYTVKKLRVPYEERLIRDAPGFDETRDFSEAEEQQIYAHYQLAQRLGGERSHLTGGRMARGSRMRESASDSTEIPLYEERVDVGKEMVEDRKVRLRKVVRTDTVNVPVDLTRERIEIERLSPAELRGTYSGRPFGDTEDVVMTERHEEPVIRKHDEIIGGVRAHRELDTERRDVSAVVRREDVEVDREGSSSSLEDQ